MNKFFKYLPLTIVTLVVLEGSWCLPKLGFLYQWDLKSNKCLSPKDCGHSECCRVGMDRYSIPVCSPLGKLGDDCRPGSKPENLSLSYPNHTTIHTTDTYTVLCPCGDGLYCDRNVGKCNTITP
ncbi:unnamed protein product [Allacma fusca]|uniref:Prokineticin domain-containing protein n=1 Tax=Allacma fusca TaxID=39272 RepID=A0A8J2NR63_9HEXA|nr:unnamed protein product [Allacma fusca]